MANYLHEDEPLPARTTPQGTQANGVEHGHEARDVDFRATVKWFIALVILMVVVMPFVWFGYQAALPMIEGGDQPPSPLFTQQWDLPMPRVLPNPYDAPIDRVTSLPQPLKGPAEYGSEQIAAEARALETLQLRFPDNFEDAKQAGLPRLPDQAVDAVIAKSAGSGTAAGGTLDGVKEMVPSGYSGGTRMENELR